MGWAECHKANNFALNYSKCVRSFRVQSFSELINTSMVFILYLIKRRHLYKVMKRPTDRKRKRTWLQLLTGEECVQNCEQDEMK